ncbi:hypothetical protein ASPSYDRAFT_973831 [Aspergillus sydowii CBS 593.65]|uniref:Uncharacterized protein n=1 Tax=Aspergillus sydowii CBS 593.65 TaxID=1036612 RepID=A0A1L9THB3_9EURO|nr:uncharacterized protein ASPSYDRAFT_973831 [Aspergillus sydowii CBS 593.65]OJJ58792.1 hypothetical protein ASPSYDRAFT_973831 [Aspergillus sydowii CBS 593.65]
MNILDTASDLGAKMRRSRTAQCAQRPSPAPRKRVGLLVSRWFLMYFPIPDIVIAVIILKIYPGGSPPVYPWQCFCISILCHPNEDANTPPSIAELCYKRFPWIRRIRLAGSALETRAILFPGFYTDRSYTRFGKLFVRCLFLRFCQIWGLPVLR